MFKVKTVKLYTEDVGEYLYDLRECKNLSTKSIEHNKNIYIKQPW